MSEKLSPDAVLNVAAQLFMSTPKNKIDRLEGAGEKFALRMENRVDDFVRFYRRLRDKLKEDE